MNETNPTPLPSFALFPPSHLRKQISPTEWETFIDSWTALVQRFLSLPVESFVARARDKSCRLFEFLATLFKEACHRDLDTGPGVKEAKLQRLCFLLVKRLITDTDAIWPPLGEPSFIGDFCSLYLGNPMLYSLMERLWSSLSLDKSPQMLKNKAKLVQVLGEAGGLPLSDLESSLRRLLGTVKACSSYALFLMQGSDFWDTILNAWRSGSEAFRSKTMAIIYYSLTSLLNGGSSKVSLLLDHLFSLVSDDENSRKGKKNLVLTELVCATPFLRKFRGHIDATSSTGRSKSMLQSLESIKAASTQDYPRSTGRSIHHYRAKQRSPHEPHVHKMSLVTEVQDLFPDLTASSIVELLDEFGEDVEQVIAHLLDNQPISKTDNATQ